MPLDQCFGSLSVWICIEMAPVDPDTLGLRIRNQDSQDGVRQGEKNLRFQTEKNIDHLAKGLMVFT